MGFWDFMSGTTPGGAIGQVGKDVVTGIFDGVGKIIDEFHVSQEEKVQMKLAMAEHKLKAMEVLIADVQNARQMQMQTRSVWPGIMSALAAGGFFGGFFCLLFYGIPTNTDEMTKTIINMFAGAMIAAFSDARSFWLGSTAGSQNKDHLIYNSTPLKKDA